MSALPAKTPESAPSKSSVKLPIEVPKNGRIVVVEQVVFRLPGGDGQAVDSRFVRHLSSDEQLYVRTLTVGEEWMPLDLGWVENPSMIVVVNREGVFTQVQPTEEERKDAKMRVVEIKHKDSSTGWLVPPGESFRGAPTCPGNLEICCHRGKAKIVVSVYPE